MKRPLYILFAMLFFACSGKEPLPDTETPEESPIIGELVNENAMPAAKNVYAFLRTEYGKRTIIGTMADYGANINEAQWLYEQTGKWSALNCFDFIDCTRSWNWQPNNNANLISAAKTWWQNRGLVSIMWHWRDPSRTTDEFYTSETGFDISKISNTGSSEYAQMISDIDLMAVLLKELQTAGVPVLWRPLHEASGGWFWWGAKGATACKQLWRVMYERLVEHHGINNLIWIWTTEGADMSWYPGDEYVDVIGRDLYNTNFVSEYNKVNGLFDGKKLVALTECGTLPVITDAPQWSWVMPWYGEHTHQWNTVASWTEWMASDKVITRDKMPSLK